MIYLCVKDGLAFVWNADDWLELRKNHRIVGQLIGSIANLPQQETFTGLPMTLLPEETLLLVEKGLATTVHYPALYKKPTEDIRKQYKAYIEELNKEQVEIAKEERKQQIIMNIDRIVEGKRKKLTNTKPRKKKALDDSSRLEEKDISSEEDSSEVEDREEESTDMEQISKSGREASGCDKRDKPGGGKNTADLKDIATEENITSGDKESDDSLTKKIPEVDDMEISTEISTFNAEPKVTKISKEVVLQEEFDKIRPLDPSNIMVQTYMECPWIKKDEMETVKIRLPKTYLKKLRYHTFKALWEKGYYLTSGSKFGVDFLVYPGDPLKFHAYFLVKCLNYNTSIPVRQLICYGRLGHSVRKTFVFASFDDGGEVKFVSLNWAEMK